MSTTTGGTALPAAITAPIIDNNESDLFHDSYGSINYDTILNVLISDSDINLIRSTLLRLIELLYNNIHIPIFIDKGILNNINHLKNVYITDDQIRFYIISIYLIISKSSFRVNLNKDIINDIIKLCTDEVLEIRKFALESLYQFANNKYETESITTPVCQKIYLKIIKTDLSDVVRNDCLVLLTKCFRIDGFSSHFISQSGLEALLSLLIFPGALVRATACKCLSILCESLAVRNSLLNSADLKVVISLLEDDDRRVRTEITGLLMYLLLECKKKSFDLEVVPKLLRVLDESGTNETLILNTLQCINVMGEYHPAKPELSNPKATKLIEFYVIFAGNDMIQTVANRAIATISWKN